MIKFGKAFQEELATLSPAEKESRIGLRRMVAGALLVTLAGGGYLANRAVENDAQAHLGNKLSQPINLVISELKNGKINSKDVQAGVVPEGVSTADQVAKKAAKPADEAIARDIIQKQESGNIGGGETFILPTVDVEPESTVYGHGIENH